MSTRPERLTDYAAILLAVGTYALILGLIVHRYATTGEINRWMLVALAIMGGVSVIALFGYEKLERVVRLLDK